MSIEINYIILAHKAPQQVKRLIGRLNSPNSNFYIHIDKSIDKKPFLSAFKNKKRVHFSSDNNREYGTWGDIGIVKATIHILNKIIKDERGGYCVLLSGQDYPIQSNKSISSFFELNYGTCFIEIFSIPFTGWANNGGLDRLNKYKINISNERNDFIQLSSIFEKPFYKKQSYGKVKKLLRSKQFTDLAKLFFKRQSQKHIKPFGGSQWWAFPIEMIISILDYIEKNPEYLKYHKNTLLPDEIFFHSILMYLKERNNTISIKPSITYVNWKRKNTKLPVTFTIDDLAELKEKSKEKLFARKFDVEIDQKILDQIDNHLLD